MNNVQCYVLFSIELDYAMFTCNVQKEMKKKHEKELQALEVTQRLLLNVYYDVIVCAGGK